MFSRSNTPAFTVSLPITHSSVRGSLQPRASSCRPQTARHATRMMAGGVPKVPYKAPGAQSYEFIDIFNRLYRERIMYIGQDLDDEVANQTIAVMLYLEQEDSEKQVSFYFNSPGGTVSAGLAVYDCMRAMKYPVATLNLGLAASMGAFLCGAGTKGMRMSLPNARFLLQAPSMLDPSRGQASDVAIEVKHILSQRERVINGYCSFTGKDYESVKKDLKRDMYLTAPEAREYGLIDQVLMPQDSGPTESFVAGIGASGIGIGLGKKK
eukprot:Plantae.Rhodophyta-Palmaria_palmata.ctg7330.p1 GENE.Plantae.Rhodophyta-Palmaria_palmata.ctg7330~~Plantae.Rhodophyta-Palmaria_palmata.ctg7330.p1  ORF type:complete len:267 (+),score=41.05 Plantae.Rhodophyta-Palmaria_palmata.ctg7330:127-927(+)